MQNHRSIALSSLTLLALALASGQARAGTAGQCPGTPVDGVAEIGVEVRAQALSLPGGRYALDYRASLGPADSQSTICFSGDTTLVYTLADSGRYAFRELSFDLPFGYEPAASPFKLWTVLPQSIVLHISDVPEAAGQTFKYSIKVEDRRTGAVITIDPEATERPN